MGSSKFKRKIKNYTKGYFCISNRRRESNPREIKTKTKLDSNIVRFLTVKYKKLDLKTEYFSKIKVNEKEKNLKVRKFLNKLSYFKKVMVDFQKVSFSKKCSYNRL